MDLTEEATRIFSRDQIVQWCRQATIRVKECEGIRTLIDKLRIQTLIYKMDYQEFKQALKMDETEVVHNLEEFTVPDCFGYVEHIYPCTDCILYNLCIQDLVNSLPPCYGILYKGAMYSECNECMVRQHCCWQTSYQPKLNNQVWELQEWPILDNILKALALFRSKFWSWPIKFEMYKYNRLPNMVIRKAQMRRVTTVRKGTPWGMWVMYAGEEKEYPIVRTPVTFKGDRTNVTDGKDRSTLG